MNTTRPAFDSARPWLVFVECIVDGEDLSHHFTTCCCKRMAEDEARRMDRSHLNVRIERMRPVPRKGAFGGWRIAPTTTAKKCIHA